MRRFWPTIAFMVAVAAGSAGVHAYVASGHKWGTTTVRYYINPQNMYVSTSEAIAAIQTGANAWNTQSNANIQLQYGGTTSGSSLTMNRVNEVFFRNDSSGAVAETYWWWDGSGTLIDADIVFHENWAWSTTSGGCSGGFYIENTAAHELGHVLGLHHSGVDVATMWPYTDYCETIRVTLDTDDVDGIESIYPPTSGGPVVNAPAAPNGPSPADGSTGLSTNVSATWFCTGADTYDVYLNGQRYAWNLTTPSVSFNSLTAGVSYTWNVVATNAGGSTTGPTWRFTTQAPTSTSGDPTPTPTPTPSPSSTKPGKGKGRNK